VEEYLFSLNPGLTVTEVSSGNFSLEFAQQVHLLKIFPDESLHAWRRDTIDVRYGGEVDGRAMYCDVPEKIRCSDVTFSELGGGLSSLERGLTLFRFARETAPVRDDYMLLIPEAMWYPIPGLPYNPRYPREDQKEFSRFRLSVKPRNGLKAVSQGRLTVDDTAEFIFEPEHPLTGITLAIGEYQTRTMEADSIAYNLHSSPESEKLLDLLDCVADTIPMLISDRKDRLEYSLGLDYPFERLALLEVPVSFSPFKRPLRSAGSDYVQPEMVFIHEKGVTLGISALPVWLDPGTDDYLQDESQREERIKQTAVMTLTMALGDLYRDSPFSIYPMYFSMVKGVKGRRYPYLGLLLDQMAREGTRISEKNRRWSEDGFTDSERAGRLLNDGDFIDACLDPRHYNGAGRLVGCWSGHHYYLVDAMSRNGAVKEFIGDLVGSGRFTNIREEELLELFAERFGFRMESILIDLEGRTDVPGYLISDYYCCAFTDGERERYRFSFDILNREGTGGVIVVTGTLKYPRAVKKRMKKKGLKNPVLAIETVRPGEKRRVDVLLDFEPRNIWVNMMLTRNIPSKVYWGRGLNIHSSCGRGGRTFNGIDLTDFEEESIVVDDADREFGTVGGESQNLLRRIFSRSGSRKEYRDPMYIKKNPPGDWQIYVDKGFFGSYMRSARAIKAGNGGARAIWRTNIPESGMYDLYSYIFDPFGFYTAKHRERENLDRIEYHYTVHHADGETETVLMPGNCEDGWNLIGRYYFDKGEAVVELSDESPYNYVIADAVKWVRKD
jgi:hypothetical protein